MAISNLLPRKTMKNRTRLASMDERHKYDQKPEKTQNGELVSSYMCSPETAAEEFEISKRLYYRITGRSQPEKRDIIMYRVIQSFKPGEVTPEEANRIGYELAMKFTGGRHQFVVSTHIDKAHIHNHIEFNSVNLDCDGKFQNVKDSAMILRRMNDEICRAHGLSVIENPRTDAKEPGEAAAMKYGVSFKERLRQAIDRILPECKDFEEFLARMRSEGYEIKRGKYLEFRAPGQLRFTRSFRLGNSYTWDALQERCGKQQGHTGEAKSPVGAKKPTARYPARKVNPLIDIQAKLAAGKGAGYENWAGIFNLQEASKTINFLTENGLTDYDELVAQAERAGAKFDAASRRIKRLEARMAEIAQLKAHIIRYVKTKDVYAAYRKAGNKAEFLNEHAEEIAQYEAAKKAFDALDGKPIPKVAQLSQEYGALLERKQREYEDFKKYRQEMIDLQTAKQNVDKILGIQNEELEQRRRQEIQQEQELARQRNQSQEH